MGWVGLYTLSRIFCFTQGSRIRSSARGEERDKGLGLVDRGEGQKGAGCRAAGRIIAGGGGQTQRGRWEVGAGSGG